MARKFYAFPATSGVEINLDPTLVTPGAKISEDEIRALVPPGTYIFGSADDAIQLVKVAPTFAMLAPPSLTGSAKIGGEATIAPGTFTSGATVSHVLVYQDESGDDIEIVADAASFTWTATYNARLVRVVTTATLGADTLTVASPYQAVTYNAPTRAGALPDVTYTEDSGVKTVSAAGDFSVGGDASLAGITWSVTGTGATIDTAGVVTITTADARENSTVTVTATNSGGSVSSAFDVTVDLTIRFGALTPTGDGGAQARDSDGAAIDITSIDSQPSTRWTLASGKLVATGSPAMASEQITATVDGASVTINIVVVPNMISVADATEFAAVSMTQAGIGDFTIELRAGVSIAAADANTKLAGTSGSPRVLGGTLTLIGELEAGLPSANIDGKFRLKFFSGGAVVFKDCNLSPSNVSDQSFFNGVASALIECARSPTTDFTIDGIHTVGNPAMLTGWPGKTANNGTNDWGCDTWGALIRVNAVSGTSRPYVDGQVDDGPDIVTFTGSGVKRVLMGIRSLGGGVYELHVGDKSGSFHSIPTNAVSGDHTASQILIGDTVSGLDGFAATVIAPPTGVDTAGGRYAGEAAYTYLMRGPRWYDTADGKQNSGTANTVRNLTIRNCNVRCINEGIHPYAIQKVIIEQNSFGMFTQDLIKLGNPVANPNFEWVIRRNDFWGAMQRPSDLGAEHNDYIQIFGGQPDGIWKMKIHHNRWLCNGRGNGQGLWLGDSPPLFDSQFFGNIFVLYNGGNASIMKFMSNCQAAHNTVIVNQKDEGLPANWAPGNGGTMSATFDSFTPGTNLYVGWNAIKRFQLTTVKTEKNFGLNGNTSMAQDALFVGLGATKPTRPFFFETFDEVMIGAQVTLTGGDDKVGALGSNSDWTGYPHRVTTDDSHLPFTLDYEPGDVS